MSNYHQAKQKAKLAGFSKLLGTDKNSFILLSDKTDGRAGRYVYINADLSEIFLNIVSKDKHNLFLNRMEQLCSTAGGMQSYSNLKSAFEHFSTILGLQIGYKIIPMTGSKGHKPGVYITSMKASQLNGQQPGFYDVKQHGNDWRVSKRPKDYISSSYAAINGLTSNLKMSANEIMPPMLEKAYADRKWGHESVNVAGYSLMYNPPVLYHEDKEWKTPAHKTQGQDFTANILSEAMIKTQQSGKKVKWVVHGDGAKVFHKAIQRLQGKDLSNHTFLFAAPSEDMTKILPLMRLSKMKLHDDVMVYQDDDWTHSKNRTSKKVGQEVSKFGGEFSAKGSKMQDKAGKSRYDLNVGKRLGAANFGYGAAATAATAIGAGIPALTAAAVTAGVFIAAKTAVSIPGMIYNSQSLRNIAMDKVVNPDLNPHLNPYANREDMNALFKQHSGGKFKTFATIIKSLAK